MFDWRSEWGVGVVETISPDGVGARVAGVVAASADVEAQRVVVHNRGRCLPGAVPAGFPESEVGGGRFETSRC